VGPSRKSFIGNILNLPVGDRLEGTLASVVACVLNGAHVVRIHDVREVKRVVLVADAIRRAGLPVVAQQSAD
jgi:dihydropteroate synthase